MVSIRTISRLLLEGCLMEATSKYIRKVGPKMSTTMVIGMKVPVIILARGISKIRREKILVRKIDRVE